MRSLRLLDRYRDANMEFTFSGALGGALEGCFRVASDDDQASLLVIASARDGWDHVSVSRADRIPTWAEMEQVKRLFFRDDECAMQLHVPVAEHVNNHNHCLHLWRPLGQPIPRPAGAFVGAAGMTSEQVRAMTTDDRRALMLRTMDAYFRKD